MEHLYPKYQREKLRSVFSSLLPQIGKGLLKLKEVARADRNEKMKEQYRFLSDRCITSDVDIDFQHFLFQFCIIEKRVMENSQHFLVFIFSFHNVASVV